MYIYIQKFFHPHKTQEDEQGNSKGYAVHRPSFPLLLFFVHLISTLGGLAIVQVAYGDLIHKLPQSFGLGVYSTNTIFFTVLFTGGMEGSLFVDSTEEAADAVATPIMFGSLLYVLLYSASSSTDNRSLQLECILLLLLWVGTDSSSSLSTLFTIVCVEVLLLSSESEFHFWKMLATLLFNDQKGLNSLFHLLYFSVHVYTSSLNVCSPVLILTFNTTSIIWSGSSQVN